MITKYNYTELTLYLLIFTNIFYFHIYCHLICWNAFSAVLTGRVIMTPIHCACSDALIVKFFIVVLWLNLEFPRGLILVVWSSPNWPNHWGTVGLNKPKLKFIEYLSIWYFDKISFKWTLFVLVSHQTSRPIPIAINILENGLVTSP